MTDLTPEEKERLKQRLEGRRLLRRKVCGKPHRTMRAARQGVTTAQAWGWRDVRIELRFGGEYFVVTGLDFGSEPPENKTGVSAPGLPRRYRWPDK